MPGSPVRPATIPGVTPGRGPARSRQGEDSTPRIYRLTPSYDRTAGGSVITLTGDFFIAESDGSTPVVLIGGLPATGVTIVNRNTLTAVAPANTVGLVDVQITNAHGQTSTLEDSFTYLEARIVSVDPNRGPIAGGTTVVIEGVNFLPGATVTFGGVAATGVEYIDSSHYSAITPAHAVGPVVVAVDAATIQGAFYFTLLIAGNDIRRQPGVRIHETMNSAPNTCTFRIDGRSAPPKAASEVSVTDGPKKLFAGIATRVLEEYEENITDLTWNVSAVDYVYWLNRRRPFGNYVCKSITSIAKDLITRYAPWATTNHVQANLPSVSISFNGTEDFAACLSRMVRMMGGGQWKMDYDKDLHLFRKVRSGQVSVVGMVFAVPDIKLPETSIGLSLGAGNAMEASLSSVLISNGSRGGVWAAYFSTLVYSNGIESAPSLLSNPLYIEGNRYIHLEDIPTGAPIGSLTVTKRNIYCVFIRGGAALKTFPVGHIPDNSTTSTDIPGNSISIAGVRFSAKMPNTAPAPAPTGGISVDESNLSVGQARYNRATLAYVNTQTTTFTLGMSASYTPGIYMFRATNLYANGTESLPGPASSQIRLPSASSGWGGGKITTSDDYKAIEVRAPAGAPLDGVPVIARKVYGTFLGSSGSSYEPWQSGNSFGWDLIPNNDEDRRTLIISSLGGGSPSGNVPPSTKPIVQCENTTDVGPDLENVDPPEEINDASTTFLRTNPVTTEVDVSQLRNRATIYGVAITVSKTAAVGDTILYVTTTEGQHPIGGAFVIPELGVSVEQVGLSQTAAGDTLMFIKERLPIAIESGTTLRALVSLNDEASQKFMGSIELDENGNPTDGVHEIVIDEPSLVTQLEIISRARAELELFAWPIVNINYSTRDQNSHPGKEVRWNLSHPPIKGTFLIQEVDIDQINEDADLDELAPRFNVRASSLRFDLDDLLMLITQSFPATPTMRGISATSGGGILQAEATITIAGTQLNNGELVTLVPSYGPGTVIVPTTIATSKDNTGGVAYGTGGTAALRWKGQTGVNIASVGLDLNNVRITQNVTSVSAVSTTSDVGTDRDLVLAWATAPVGSTGSSSLKITVSYMIMGTGL